MTEKELLYLEDVIKHEQNLEMLSIIFSSELQDSELKKFLANTAKKHCNLQKQFLNILEDKAHE